MVRAKRETLTTQQHKAIALQVTKELNNMTDEDIAEEIGVNRSTLYDWRKQELYNSELIKQAEEIQKNFLPEAYLQLRRIITNPKSKESSKLKGIELLLKQFGRLKDVREDTVVIKSMDAEVEEALEELENM